MLNYWHKAIGTDTVDKSIDSVRMFNDLHAFKKNLNDTMAVTRQDYINYKFLNVRSMSSIIGV